METVHTVFWVIGALAFLEALYSAKSGVAYLQLFRRFVNRPPERFAPPSTLFVPCKGVDAGLESNLRAYFRQDYPDFQLLLVTGEETDSCVPIIRRLQEQHSQVCSRVLFSGQTRKRGQKVHNLLYALQFVRSQDQVLAFGDSDIRPAANWLLRLIGPLEDREIGMTTGYRWYVSPSGRFAAVMRSVWNAGVASLLKEQDSFFAWGGSMAVRREVFEACRVVEHWHGALSDDYAISRAVKEASLSIHFRPHCLSFSYEDCSWTEFLNWSSRQLSITHVYHPSLWTMAFVSQGVNCLTLWGGSVAVILGWIQGVFPVGLAILLGVIYLLGCWKGWLRVRAVSTLFPGQEAMLRRDLGAYVFWGPLASLVSLLGLIRSLLSRDIEWRGIRYRMLSPQETVVLDGQGCYSASGRVEGRN